MRSPPHFSMLPKNIDLFFKSALQKRPLLCKSDLVFKEPTNHSHPIPGESITKEKLNLIFREREIVSHLSRETYERNRLEFLSHTGKVYSSCMREESGLLLSFVSHNRSDVFLSLETHHKKTCQKA